MTWKITLRLAICRSLTLLGRTETKLRTLKQFKIHTNVSNFEAASPKTVSLEGFLTNLVSVRPQSIKLGQIANLNVIFHVMVSIYRLVQIWNLPRFPAQFRNGLQLDISFCWRDLIFDDDSGILGKKIRVLLCRSRTYDLPTTTSDALRLRCSSFIVFFFSF